MPSCWPWGGSNSVVEGPFGGLRPCAFSGLFGGPKPRQGCEGRRRLWPDTVSRARPPPMWLRPLRPDHGWPRKCLGSWCWNGRWKMSSPSAVASFTAPRRGSGGGLVGGGAELSPLHPPPALPRLTHRLLADALRADASSCFPLPLSCLPTGAPPSAGVVGGGTRADQRLAGPNVGLAGGGGAL